MSFLSIMAGGQPGRMRRDPGQQCITRQRHGTHDNDRSPRQHVLVMRPAVVRKEGAQMPVLASAPRGNCIPGQRPVRVAGHCADYHFQVS